LQTKQPKRSRSSIRVLVVDDFSPVANAILNILSSNFYEARAAYTAADALEIAEQFMPHVLISDVILPDMDGFNLAAKFAQRHPGCRVLLMSVGLERVLENDAGLRVVRKVSALEELFRLLEDCRG